MSERERGGVTPERGGGKEKGVRYCQAVLPERSNSSRASISTGQDTDAEWKYGEYTPTAAPGRDEEGILLILFGAPNKQSTSENTYI